MDARDDLTWIAIELSHLGEQKVEDGTIESDLKKHLGSTLVEVFIPATTYSKGKRSITIHLMEGYVFVTSGLPETTYFGLEKRAYVNSVMSTRQGPHKMRALSTIPHAHIEELRAKMREMASRDIEQGTPVRVEHGKYRTLEGRVLEVDEDKAVVEIRLRSLLIKASIPRVFLEQIEENEVPDREAGEIILPY